IDIGDVCEEMCALGRPMAELANASQLGPWSIQSSSNIIAQSKAVEARLPFMAFANTIYYERLNSFFSPYSPRNGELSSDAREETVCCRTVQALQLTYADTHPMYTLESYPNFFRVVPSESVFNQARVSLLKHFNWTRVGTLYQTNPRYALTRFPGAATIRSPKHLLIVPLYGLGSGSKGPGNRSPSVGRFLEKWLFGALCYLILALQISDRAVYGAVVKLPGFVVLDVLKHRYDGSELPPSFLSAPENFSFASD
ncbi:hypothetical protein HPB47_007376, partial [Ixodes persulcatus]